MIALLVARDYTYDKLNRPRPSRVGSRGIAGLKPGVVLGTAASHYSIEKALWFLGLGHEDLVRVPVCYDEAMAAEAFRQERFLEGVRHEPWRSRLHTAVAADRKLGAAELVDFYSGKQNPFGLQPLGSDIMKTLYSCFEFDVPLIASILTLGTTDTGTIERVDTEAVDLLREEDVYIHVDAATGGFAFVSDDVKTKMNKLDAIDSFTIDPHKMGFLHYPCGAVVFRDRGFREQIYHQAPYLGPLAPTLEGSRPGGPSAALWFALKTIGVDGYKQMVNHLLKFASELNKAFATSKQFQVLHRVDLNAMAVAPFPEDSETRRDVNGLVRAVREKVLQRSKFLVNIDRHLSAVKVRNDPNQPESDIVDIGALRIVVTNPLVELDDAQRLVDDLCTYLVEARAEAGKGLARPTSTLRSFSEEP
ncbi:MULTISPECIES: pyridoxal phosphate-dependent decarboxylase family protein [Bradyrhizobium]|uniref:pyridoxal phosphate-dependent decarboxylase family protein n=1 Tax=Bradyrhizobium TaxID=374 RepID=UPI00155EFB58|nr:MULTISPECIES: pyridoxal-dependent decarboxylase [Bradyrhizobium]MDD1522918.1 hypothetical protein [Bradyrhizobium sp. WBAH30]MDD1546888.1 hypothetical protein [Bradyrhizobium sp. WBAH41]MDD1560574.1 hypothetical protein [Bradyrhizobium sp. WBAH23]MDD1567980.1 hypothetical protein [Bradyrhizobium sp. WBAH33]MDD1593960.1 hypothetical protein [Bradyrhizobium sp. WBAH42]